MGASLANAGYARSTVPPNRSRIARCKRKFLRFLGFRDETYLDWERGYKIRAHEEWQSVLNRTEYQSKLSQGRFLEIGIEAVKIESRTLLFSFEKMAVRDTLKSERGARRGRDRLDRCGRLRGRRGGRCCLPRGVVHRSRWCCRCRLPVDHSLLLHRNCNSSLSGSALRIALRPRSANVTRSGSRAASYKALRRRRTRRERGGAAADAARSEAWEVQVVRPHWERHSAVLRLQLVDGKVVGVSSADGAVVAPGARDREHSVPANRERGCGCQQRRGIGSRSCTKLSSDT